MIRGLSTHPPSACESTEIQEYSFLFYWYEWNASEAELLTLYHSSELLTLYHSSNMQVIRSTKEGSQTHPSRYLTNNQTSYHDDQLDPHLQSADPLLWFPSSFLLMDCGAEYDDSQVWFVWSIWSRLVRLMWRLHHTKPHHTKPFLPSENNPYLLLWRLNAAT